MHLVEKSENDELPLPLASSLCNQEIITRTRQLICFAFHDSEALLIVVDVLKKWAKWLVCYFLIKLTHFPLLKIIYANNI